MREFRLCVVVVLSLLTIAGAQSKPAPDNPEKSQAAPNDSRLPVKRVVLYKNGVGYFEHTARVRGNQDLAIDFTTGQLNDVLKSLTVVDLGEGHISGVRYNSIAQFDERLKALHLPFGEQVNLLQRYTRQLDSQEDRLSMMAKETTDLQQKYVQAQAQLDRPVQDITLDEHF